MHQEQFAWVGVGVLAVVCLVLLVVLARGRRAGVLERARTDAILEDLRSRLEELEGDRGPDRVVTPDQRVSRPEDEAEFVITGIPAEPSRGGGSGPISPEVPIDAPAFADTVLRETVVKAASLAHGVRRGLAPATRNRIRFEMKQEVRRARRQRKADLKQAQRDLHARQRAMLAEEAEAS